MKSAFLFLLLTAPLAASAQIKGARDYTRRIDSQLPPRATPYVGTPAANATTAPASKPVTQADKDAADVKLLEYQKIKAKGGSDYAQYELGLRYLNGRGVEKDEAKAKEYFENAAKSGHSQAKKQLELMKKPPGTAIIAVKPASK